MTTIFDFSVRKICDRCRINYGNFSVLDLSKPIDLNIHADSNLDDILAALDSYIIK